MSAFLRDLRFGFRMLFKNPVMSGIAVVTFALGIGLTTTVFSIVNGALLDGLPYEDSDRIVSVARIDMANDARPTGVTAHDYRTYQEQQTSFSVLAAYTGRAINIVDSEGSAVRYNGAAIEASMFDLLRVSPAIGRRFFPSDNEVGAPAVALLSWDAWQERFGGEDSVVGTTVRLNGRTATIVGVMPDGFAFPDRQLMWVPLTLDFSMARDQSPQYRILGRLLDGVSIDAAAAQIATFADRLSVEFPETNENFSATVDTYVKLDMGPEIFGLLYTMLGAVIGVLLIACANVANLLLARSAARTREVAVRTALGAGRGQVIRQLMTETMILAVVGSAIGIGLGYAGVAWWNNALQISPPPAWMVFEIDRDVVMFVIGMTVFSALASGLVPAIKASNTDIGEVLKDEGRGSSSFRMGRFSGSLVVGEIAVSCGLLFVSGLMIKSVTQLRNIPMPFATETVLTGRLNLPDGDYPEVADRVAFYEELLPLLAAVPGVAAATLSDGLPASGNGRMPIEIEGMTYPEEDDYPRPREGIVAAGYFSTFEVPVIRGRAFEESDRSDAPLVAVVNESFVNTLLPDGDALGRRFKIRIGNILAEGSRPDDWFTIVGIVPNLYMEGIGNSRGSPMGYYIPIAQTGVGNTVNFALRVSAGNPLAIAPQVRQVVAGVDRNLPIYRVMDMPAVIARSTWFYNVFGKLFMAFGFASLFLAAVGLYGVMSFTVGIRQHEMGVRLALGATGKNLVSLMMRRGLVQTAIGLVLGMGIAALATTPLEFVLYKVDARDPVVFGIIALTLGLTGVVASLIPASRVTKLDPNSALRAD